MKMKTVWMGLLCVMMLTARMVYADADKPAFYAAMTSGSLDDVERELQVVGDSDQGYAGALLIRKASLVPKVKEKLKLFKAGKAKLEAALAEHPENTEYHFLRLSIQEHAPRIIGYKSKLQADKDFVVKHFSQLPLVVQRVVRDYCSRSKILKPADLISDHS